jgi:2-polyprenyl-3-methyl-5-hydroxy-6-metoxy-1,4-benzoquinol methylase
MGVPGHIFAKTGEVELISQPQAHSFVEGWYEHNSESHFWFQWRLAALLRQLRELNISLTTPFKVLEVGAGVGVLRTQIESATYWNVDITDLDLQALQQAKAGRGRKLYYDIFEQRAEFREAYDLVVLFDVLEHIADTPPFLAALLYHLKPQGWLLVNVPALQSLYSHYDELVGHVRRYNPQTLAAEFQPGQLAVADVRYWGMSLVPVVALRKLALRLLSGRSTAQKVSVGFSPPHPLVQHFFLALMRLENSLPLSYPAGTSLLLAGRKI